MKLIAKLTSAEGELHQRSEITERLKDRLGLDESWEIVRVDFDPVTGLGLYRAISLNCQPSRPESKIMSCTENVALYDGEARQISLLEGLKSQVMVVRKTNSSKPVLAIFDYLSSLNARQHSAMLGNRLFRFSNNTVSETADLDLPLDKIKHLELAPDSEGVLIEFDDTLVRQRGKTL